MLITIVGVIIGVVFSILYIYIIYNTLDKLLPYILMKKMLGKNAPRMPGEFIFLTGFSFVFTFYYVYLGVVLIQTLFGG